MHESSLLFWKSTSHENRLQIHPLSLDDIELGKIFIDTADLLFNLLNLIGKWREIPGLFQGKDETLVITYLGDDVFPLFDQWCLSSV